MKHQNLTGNIAKSDTAGLIYVPIYAPWRVDTQVEAILPELIARTAQKFADDGRLSNVKISWVTGAHQGAVKADAEIVDWFLSEDGDERFPVPGTWGAAIQLNDQSLINAVESGQINAVSLESEYPPKRTPLPTLVRNPISAKGDTEPTLSGTYPPHTHPVNLLFDGMARIVPTMTGFAHGHQHRITKPTAVKSDSGHGHPLDLQKLKTEYQDTLQIVTWLSDLSVESITLVEHAASWMPIVALKGDNDMAGGIVQAIIVPDGVDIEMLKDLLGEDYQKIRTDNAEKDNGSIVYVQANKADFDELSEPIQFRDTPIKVITGKPKAEKADLLAYPMGTPVATVTETRSVTVSDVLWNQTSAMRDLICGAFGQSMDVSARQQLVMTAIDNFRNAMLELVATVGEANEDMAYKSDDNTSRYGVGDLASRLVAEIKKTNKQMLEEFKGIAKKTEKIITNNETNLDDTGQANKGEFDMDKSELKEAFAEFAKELGLVKEEPKMAADTTPDLTEQLKPLNETIEKMNATVAAMRAELDESKQAAEALKSDNDSLKEELKKSQETLEAIQRTAVPGASVDAYGSFKADASDAPTASAWQGNFEKRIIHRAVMREAQAG